MGDEQQVKLVQADQLAQRHVAVTEVQFRAILIARSFPQHWNLEVVAASVEEKLWSAVTRIAFNPVLAY